MSAPLKVGFLGTGKMATALAKGFIDAGLAPVDHVLGSDPFEAAREQFTQATAARTVPDNHAVAQSATVLILAVKPNQVRAVLEDLQPLLTADHLLISIAAGITLSRMQACVNSEVRMLRAMPNTPALVGAGATGYARGTAATAEDAELAQKLFSAVGVAFEVKESLLDAVTGLSGSGPAYVFQMIEALSDGGVSVGLPRVMATRLAAQTLLGAARLVLETDYHPAQLKDQVTSPGGTTLEGLYALEAAGVRAALIQAVRAATDKARELSV